MYEPIPKSVFYWPVFPFRWNLNSPYQAVLFSDITRTLILAHGPIKETITSFGFAFQLVSLTDLAKIFYFIYGFLLYLRHKSFVWWYFFINKLAAKLCQDFAFGRLPQSKRLAIWRMYLIRVSAADKNPYENNTALSNPNIGNSLTQAEEKSWRLRRTNRRDKIKGRFKSLKPSRSHTARIPSIAVWHRHRKIRRRDRNEIYTPDGWFLVKRLSHEPAQSQATAKQSNGKKQKKPEANKRLQRHGILE